MSEIEILETIGKIAQSITVTGLLMTWIFLERRARMTLSNKILEDWDDLRRDREKEVKSTA